MRGLRRCVKHSILVVMEKLQRTATKRLGRPLSFDRDKALDAAVLQFWRTGYESTSVAELTHAMGITAPSLYTAFGDKESLFLECLDKYANPGPKTTPELVRGVQWVGRLTAGTSRSSKRTPSKPGGSSKTGGAGHPQRAAPENSKRAGSRSDDNGHCPRHVYPGTRWR